MSDLTLSMRPGDTAVIGTADDCDLVVVDEYASPHHAKVTITGQGERLVEDLGSINGVYWGSLRVINGVVYPKYPVRVGRTLIVIEVLP
jgi:pSer/pThr/pTyr-binding forkhead associated (FHA) protein